jgi:hypothetical protein
MRCDLQGIAWPVHRLRYVGHPEASPRPHHPSLGAICMVMVSPSKYVVV